MVSAAVFPLYTPPSIVWVMARPRYIASIDACACYNYFSDFPMILEDKNGHYGVRRSLWQASSICFKRAWFSVNPNSTHMDN
jgi:hypothetical protein